MSASTRTQPPRHLSGITTSSSHLVDSDQPSGEEEGPSRLHTPGSEPPSGLNTPGSDSGAELVATSTVITEFQRRPRNQSESLDSTSTSAASRRTGGGGNRETQTTTVTHLGAKGLEHQIDQDGGIHLTPQQSASSRRKGKKIRAVVSFKPRHSHFDSFNREGEKDPFRGFYTLFWIAMGILMLNTFYTSFTTTGRIISLTFANLFSQDAGVLALSDAILVGSLFLCVPFAKALKWGWMSYWPTGVVIQHAWQGAMLGSVIKWARYREWPWVQSGFFVLHTISMMMKIHSYLAVNGAMSQATTRMQRIEKQLEERVLEVERMDSPKQSSAKEDISSPAQARAAQEATLVASWEKAVRKARDYADTVEESQPLRVAADSEEVPSWTLPEHQRGMKGYRRKAFTGSILRPSARRSAGNGSSLREKVVPPTVEQAAADLNKAFQHDHGNPSEPQGELIRDPHPLATHPDRVIASLARDIESLREELMSVDPGHAEGAAESVMVGKESRVCWPDNVSCANFWDYLLVPTLVYELEYPRTKSVRPLYLVEKTLATFGTFFVIYVITEHFIIPHSPQSDTPLLESMLKLALPMMINYLLIFYIMFECVCNGFAEVTRFADREFYQDWWNATSMDVFSRKWNKPVHSFLLKHVYASSISSWGISKGAAMFVTFLLSAFLHEVVMAIVSGKIRGYLFGAQMAQLPLILLSRVPFIRNNEALGNLIFWIGLMLGFPVLNIAYLVY